MEEEFTSDFYFSATWPDASVCAAGSNPEDNQFDPGNSWTPNFDFTNINGPIQAYVNNPYSIISTPVQKFQSAKTNPSKPRNVLNEYWGNCWVNFDQRYTGAFSTPLKLDEFPYDKQNVTISLESQLYDSTKLQVHL